MNYIGDCIRLKNDYRFSGYYINNNSIYTKIFVGDNLDIEMSFFQEDYINIWEKYD